MRGLLVRQIPVRLVNLSLSGFLLESENQIDVGSTGELRVDLGGAQYSDQVRVARTLADLEAVDAIASHHISEAIQYRTLDRQLW